MNIQQLIELLEKEVPDLDEELLTAYYENDEEFADWRSGNFNDDVQLGVEIGTYETLVDIISKLKTVEENI